jgi:DNA-directed RNA polymerase subunit K/omega
MDPKSFTTYEKARILGARALQIAMNAPLLIKFSEEDLEKINYDALKIAEIELESAVLPISVKKPLPQKKEMKLKRPPEKILTDAQKKKIEEEESKSVEEEGEIMELVKDEEEIDNEELNEED